MRSVWECMGSVGVFATVCRCLPLFATVCRTVSFCLCVPNLPPTGDSKAALAINRKVYVTSDTSDKEYLADVGKALDTSISSFKPDIIYYNAGTDILVGDPLNGGVHISAQGICDRDEMVFSKALGAGIPVVMVLSGGYAPNNAAVVAESLVNLVTKCNLIGAIAEQQQVKVQEEQVPPPPPHQP